MLSAALLLLQTPAIKPRSESFFGAHFDLHAHEFDKELGAEMTEERLLQYFDAVRPNFIQWDAKGHPGWSGWPTKIGKAAGQVKDSLAILRAATRKRGVGLYAHFSGIEDHVAIQLNPSFAAIEANGQPSKTKNSSFGPYTTQYMIPQLKDLIGRYDLDGVWVDGDCWAARPDYSPTAMAAWKSQTGKSEAPKSKSDADWPAWLKFHQDRFESHVRTYVDEIHRWRPGVQIASNWMYTHHAPRPIQTGVDFISGDFTPENAVDHARFYARYIEAMGRPWDLMAWGFFSEAPHGGLRKTVDQLSQEASVVLMTGGGFQVYNVPTRRGYIDEEILNKTTAVSQFCRDRKELSWKSRAVPQVALVLPAAQSLSEFNDVYGPWGVYFDIEGALRAMLAAKYSVEVVADHRLAGRLKDYPAVAFVKCRSISPSFRQEVIDYVKGGGRLILLDGVSAQTFSSLVDGESTWNEEIDDVVIQPGMPAIPTRWVKFQPRSGEVLVRHSGPEGERPLVWRNRVGSGTVTALLARLPLSYYETGRDAARWGIAEAMKAGYPQPDVELKGPALVDLSLRRAKDGRLTVHLFHHSLTQRAKQNYQVSNPPLTPGMTLRLKVPSRPRKLTMMPEGKSLDFTYESGWATTTVPPVAIHGIVAVD